MHALYDAGIKTVEYTNRGENALSNFSVMKKMLDADLPGLHLGIGTIKNKEQAKQFIDAGADYIICPSMNEEVASITHDAGLLWIPGCMTATEIAAAENAGATLVKIFPGSLLGPGYIHAIKDLFPGLKFMPTGGVEAEKKNLQSWFASGVVAVGIAVGRRRVDLPAHPIEGIAGQHARAAMAPGGGLVGVDFVHDFG